MQLTEDVVAAIFIPQKPPTQKVSLRPRHQIQNFGENFACNCRGERPESIAVTPNEDELGTQAHSLASVQLANTQVSRTMVFPRLLDALKRVKVSRKMRPPLRHPISCQPFRKTVQEYDTAAANTQNNHPTRHPAMIVTE